MQKSVVNFFTTDFFTPNFPLQKTNPSGEGCAGGAILVCVKEFVKGFNESRTVLS